jgi:type I restriction enzyme R subunit
LNESETRAELIDPALRQAGWGVVEGSRVRRELIAPGRLQGSGKRSKAEIADYVLVYRNQKLAVIEAKRRDLPDTEGVTQAKLNARKLQTRFTYSTNGVGIYQVDMQSGNEGYVLQYPSPEELWNRIFGQQNVWRDRFAEVPFEDKSGTWEARYYQHNAIEAALAAISEGKNRILLTLATGTGKTFIAFQLAWKLFHSRWNLNDEPTRRPRILFLADRNILADQAYNAFSAFEDRHPGSLARVKPGDIRKTGKVPKNASIFFTIFQTFMSGTDEQGQPAPYFGEYPPDFFDFIVIDECHRGGATDESNWRGIMDHFSPAVQLGLTATPKREGNVDTYAYFGEPVYVYSLKEGINDGYLSPFRVRQFATTIDDYTYTADDAVIEGEVEAGKRYTESDFNRIIVIPEREKYRVEQWLGEINPKEKTLVFCATQAHALMVRDFINQLSIGTDPEYCVRVTADEGERGEQYLRAFQDNDKTIPTILTTSQKLSTGVDARNIRNIVLMRPINSMIEFKQIVGRGTRIYEGKDYFTIYDFVRAHHHFSDPDWDGEPVGETCKKCGDFPCTCEPVVAKDCQVCGVAPCICEPVPGEPCDICGELNCTCKKRTKLKIKLSDGKVRELQSMSATSFWDADGKPISATQFLQNLFGALPALFANEDELRAIWSRPDTRKQLLGRLADAGFGDDQLAEIRKLINANDSDVFDVLAYVAFTTQPISRAERVEEHKQEIFSRYGYREQEFIEFVLEQYVRLGVSELDQDKLPILAGMKFGSISDAARAMGGVEQIRDVFVGFQRYLYEEQLSTKT